MTEWERRESGPSNADRTVLLLPGGLCSAGSYAELMAEPALAGVRLVAVTVPGHAGTPPLDDYSVEALARHTAKLAAEIGADVVVGFSLGATVALEMVTSGDFAGPTVLLGISVSAADEPAFFRAMIRAGRVLGSAPAAVLAKGATPLLKKVPVSPERRAELRADFARNVARDVQHGLSEYVGWLHRDAGRLDALARSGVDVWFVHAEKGDGGLTPAERRMLGANERARIVTIPGSVFLLPNEVPARIADVVVDALTHAR